MIQMYNPDEIISKANAMKAQSGELRALINQMTSIVEEMSSVWQSPAQSAFTKRFADIEPKLNSYCKNIDSFAERAVAQAEKVKQAEGVV